MITDFIVLETKNCTQRLPLSRVLYIEQEGRKLIFHTLKNEQFLCYKELESVMEELGSRFYLCKNGLALNLPQVERINTEEIVFLCGVRKTFSRERMRCAREGFRHYLEAVGVRR